MVAVLILVKSHGGWGTYLRRRAGRSEAEPRGARPEAVTRMRAVLVGSSCNGVLLDDVVDGRGWGIFLRDEDERHRLEREV